MTATTRVRARNSFIIVKFEFVVAHFYKTCGKKIGQAEKYITLLPSIFKLEEKKMVIFFI